MVYFGISEELADGVIMSINQIAQIAYEEDIQELLQLSAAIQSAMFPEAVTVGRIDWRQKLFVVAKAAIDTGALMPDEALAIVKKVVEDAK